MTTPRPVIGTIQQYAWGDTEFIPTLLGMDPTDDPCAELWLGTHPNGPTMFADGTPLTSVTGELPYLLKVLSAAVPLSLQAHPNAAQALDGFARGVYADASDKPELLVALTRFEAFCGVRPVPATLDLLRELGVDALAEVVATNGPGPAMTGLYRGDIDPRPAIEACRFNDRPEATWVRQLHELYPGDASVAVTLLLNYVELAPGEALHLTAGNLHGYLRGSGIELMKASDNVVRGGLTTKPVDIDELLRVIDPTPLDQPVMVGTEHSRRYELPEAAVALVVVEAGDNYVARGHELAVGLDGATFYFAPEVTFTATATTYVVTPL